MSNPIIPGDAIVNIVTIGIQNNSRTFFGNEDLRCEMRRLRELAAITLQELLERVAIGGHLEFLFDEVHREHALEVLDAVVLHVLENYGHGFSYVPDHLAVLGPLYYGGADIAWGPAVVLGMVLLLCDAKRERLTIPLRPRRIFRFLLRLDEDLLF